MRLLRSAVLPFFFLLVLVSPSFPAATTNRVAVDLGWISVVHVQDGWLVTSVGRMVTTGGKNDDAWYSWRPPLLAGDIITEIGGWSAPELSPLTMAGLLHRGFWQQTTVRLERDGRLLTLELSRKLANVEVERDWTVKELKITDTAPEFSVPDIGGTLVRSNELRGKWVLLNFWGTWCSGCYSELPALSELADRSGDKLAVLGMAMNDTEETVHKFLLKNHLRYPVLLGGKLEDSLARSFNVSACPTNVVVAPDGTVRFAGVGPQSLGTAARIVVSGITGERTQPRQ